MNLMRHNGITSISEMRRIYDNSAPSSFLVETTPKTSAPMYGNGGDKRTLESKYYDKKRERPIYDYLRYNGLNSAQAAGLMGNLAVESYLKADLHQIGGPAYGLMQAEAGRQRAMKNHPYIYEFGSGLTPEEQQQLDYIIDKGINSYTPGEWGRKGFSGARQARQAFLDTDDLNAATTIITNNFLRPGKPHTTRRQAMAEYYDDVMTSQLPYSMEKYQEGLPEFSAGGHKIHIKKANRGKFTALKKRTGHSASWFKAHGTPAQKKMAIFALNSRHWGKKKLHGGVKF